MMPSSNDVVLELWMTVPITRAGSIALRSAPQTLSNGLRSGGAGREAAIKLDIVPPWEAVLSEYNGCVRSKQRSHASRECPQCVRLESGDYEILLAQIAWLAR